MTCRSYCNRLKPRNLALGTQLPWKASLTFPRTSSDDDFDFAVSIWHIAEAKQSFCLIHEKEHFSFEKGEKKK